MTATTSLDVSTARPRLPYRPGIDGLRAIAVASVLLYHSGYAWAVGGFLGVEVFFVISGYLITSLLLAERASAGRVDLLRFWKRRALRLLPALFTLLVVTLVVSLVFLPDEVASLRGDLLAAVFYVTNWEFIIIDASYFEAVGRPPMVQHLWSLAVEEQFYVVWPLIFTAGMAWLGKRRFAVAVVAMAACSAALMWVLFDPASDPSRVYFGTDTRAAGLLLGCLLAFVWAPGRLKRDISASASYVLDGIGLVALALLIRMLFDTDEFSASLYRGGFLRLDALTLVVIAVAVHPGARLGTWLGARPLRWIGLRSYGIYLWHWPVYQLTRPGLDVPFDGAALLALRLAITFGIAELSYRFVEMPARTGAIGRWWRRRSERARARPGGSSTLALGVSAFAAALALLVLAAVRAEPPPPVDYLAIGTGDTEPTAPITTSTTAPPPTTAPATPGQAPPPTTGTTTPTTIPPPVVPIDDPVTAVGDSVMFGASNALVALGPGMTVDAEVSRQVHVGIEVLERRRAEGTLGEIILVHLGNNGLIRSEQFDRIMEIAEGRRVIFMAVKVPRQWEAHNNDVLRDGVARHPGALLIDWKAQVEAAGAGILYDDGMHVMPAGADLYATLVSETIRHSIRSVP